MIDADISAYFKGITAYTKQKKSGTLVKDCNDYKLLTVREMTRLAEQVTYKGVEIFISCLTRNFVLSNIDIFLKGATASQVNSMMVLTDFIRAYKNCKLSRKIKTPLTQIIDRE